MSKRPQSGENGESNVLLHTSAMDADGGEECLDFLTSTSTSLHRSNVLFISYRRTPDDWMRIWLDHAGKRPANLGFIHVGETTRSTMTTNTFASPPSTDQVIRTVENPDDLTTLGIAISEQLADWEENPYQTVICFDSLTTLLQSIDDVQTAYRFLHTLIGRVQTVQAQACYTIVSEAHDDQTIAILTSLFDTVYEK